MYKDNNQNNDQNKEFLYTYSASENAELKRIREKYVEQSREEDKMERLRRLDSSVTKYAQITSIIIGIIGLLILGFGMSLCMTDIGDQLGIPEANQMLTGIVVGMIGGLLTASAYPLYNRILKKRRSRVAPEILRLTEELMK